MTFKELLNNVLVNLGEDEISTAVTSLSDDYHLILRNFINHFLVEIQNSHNWGSLRKTCTATVAADAASANIQYSAADISESSRVARVPSRERQVLVPMVFNVTDSDNPLQMYERNLYELIRLQHLDDTTTSRPIDFALDPSGSAMRIRLNPRPSAEQTITLEMFVPQSRFAGDINDLNSTITLPSNAIFALEIGATWYALEERGEELGMNPLFTQKQYNDALDAAIAIDDSQGSGDDVIMVTT